MAEPMDSTAELNTDVSDDHRSPEKRGNANRSEAKIPASAYPEMNVPQWRLSLQHLLGLRYHEDLRTVLWVFLYFLITYSAWNWHEYLSVPARAAAALLLSYFGFAGATITHNTMHCRMFYNENTNKIWQMFLSLTYGHPVSTFIPGHNLSHHRYTQLLEDPMRTQKLRYKWNFLNGLLFQFSVASDVLEGDMRYLQVQKHGGRRFYTNCVREFSFVGLEAVVLILINPFKFLLYVLFPHLFAQWGIVSINMAQHDGTEIVSYEKQQENYNGSRNFVGHWVNFLTFNNGFHTIHHLQPALHWSKLREAHDRLVKLHIHPELDQPCMARFLFRQFVYPGVRIRYDGKPVTFEHDEEPADADWVAKFYPEGKTKEDFTFKPDIWWWLKTIPLLPVKVLCPTYSPIFKIM